MENTTEAQAEQQQEPQVYFNCESRLKSVLNSRRTEAQVLNLISCLNDFKQLGFILSREYLKPLVIGNHKQQSTSISKWLNKANLKTKLVFRYTKHRHGYGTIKSKQKINLILL